jgi:carboxymethylenebutenolidase
MERPPASAFAQELLDLYDDYAHGRLARREFLQRAAKFCTAGMAAETLLTQLSPNYAWAEQVPANDPRIAAEYVEYPSPQGGGKIRGLLARPAAATEKIPGVLVVHENRGLNPYIEDVARRLAVAGYLALAPDALSPLGGYPGSDDEGRALQAKRDGEEMLQDFVAGARWLRRHPACSGKVGVIGFCYGGGVAGELAVRLPEELAAAVPYYGRQPAVADAAKIACPLQFHFAELDTRINEGWPPFETALRSLGKDYEAHIYPQVNHGFHNDTTPRYDAQAAELAWKRTLEFFAKHLR